MHAQTNPEIGTISSSGVVEAIYDYWNYFEPIRVYADQQCVLTTQKITHVVDNILIGLNKPKTTAALKSVFGLPNVTYDDDFATVVGYGIDSWQGKVWDPAENDPTFDLFCGNITAKPALYPELNSRKGAVQKLLHEGGYGNEVSELTTPFLNWIGWLAQYAVDGCEGDQDSCFSTHNPQNYTPDDLSQTWRSWSYQVHIPLNPPFEPANKHTGLHRVGFPANRLRHPQRPTPFDLTYQHLGI